MELDPVKAFSFRLKENRNEWQQTLITSGSLDFMATPLMSEKSHLSI